MTITTHTAIAVAIGSVVGSPLLGFILGLVSHYAVDMIPHGDMHLREQDHGVNKQHENAGYLLVVIDVLLGITLLITLSRLLPNELTQSPAYIATIFGSVLPDALVGLNDLVKSSLGKAHAKMHFFFHDFFCRKHGDARLRNSLLVQAMFVAMVVILVS
jgi:hypothetical protein